MDPISASGIGLAVVGLTAQCFTGAMRALNLIADAKNLKSEYKYLTIRLQLEQQRCFNWAAQSGLLTYFDDENNSRSFSSSLTGLNRTAVLEVVVEIENLAVEFIKYKGRYDFLVVDSDHTEQTVLATDLALVANINGDLPVPNIEVKQFLAKTRRFSSVTELPKRIKWAAMDRARYEQLIDRLKELNDALINLMEDRIRTAIFQSTRETKLSVLQLNSKVEDLSQLIKALLPAMTTVQAHLNSQNDINQTAGMIDFPQSRKLIQAQKGQNESDDNQIIRLARFKAVNASIEEAQALDDTIAKELRINQPAKMIKSTRLERLDITLVASPRSSNLSNRDAAIYNPQGVEPRRVWIEWKDFNPMDKSLTPPPDILDRVQKLTALLCDPTKPASLRVPPCVGYVNDAEQGNANNKYPARGTDGERPPKSRFGFVFLEPGGLSMTSTATMESLRELLDMYPKPSLTKRIALAQALSSCILSLHLVDWLHKGLRSENVLFSKNETTQVDISSPYISGFDYARPAQKGERTEIPNLNPEQILYRHPDAHSKDRQLHGFRKTFDIYSLGVILVEIASWKSIVDVLKVTNSGKISAEFVRRTLLEENEIIDAVESDAGTQFAAATKACLAGKRAFGIEEMDDETDNLIGAQLSRGFYEKVLRCLEGIVT